jgi:hypothetical protein
MRHQLFRHLPGQFRLQPALNINIGQFRFFIFLIIFNFSALALQIGVFRIGLGTDRDILPRRH